MAGRYGLTTVTALARTEGMRPQSPLSAGPPILSVRAGALRVGAAAEFAAALVATWHLGTATPRRR